METARMEKLTPSFQLRVFFRCGNHFTQNRMKEEKNIRIAHKTTGQTHSENGKRGEAKKMFIVSIYLWASTKKYVGDFLLIILISIENRNVFAFFFSFVCTEVCYFTPRQQVYTFDSFGFGILEVADGNVRVEENNLPNK